MAVTSRPLSNTTALGCPRKVKVFAKSDSGYPHQYEVPRSLIQQKASVLTPDDKYPGFSWPFSDPFSLWIDIDDREKPPYTPIITLSSWARVEGTLTDYTVSIFTKWLYYDSFESQDVNVWQLVQCWVFGRVFNAPKFQNRAMAILLARVGKGAEFSARTVGFISRFTAEENSKLRKLAVDAMLNLDASDEENEMDSLTIALYLGIGCGVLRDEETLDKDEEYMV